MMPQTAFLMLGGCLSISALPPLNGFVSEWLVFQAILLSPELPQWGLKLMVPAVGAMLALGAALSAACFVRAYGIAFLGRPRSAAVTAAVETDGFSRAAMGALLTLCLLLGIISGIAIDAIAPVTQRLVGQSMPPQAGIDWLSIVPIAESRSSYSGLLVFVLHHPFHTAGDRDHPPLRVARRAARPDVGLWLPRPQSRHTVHG